MLIDTLLTLYYLCIKSGNDGQKQDLLNLKRKAKDSNEPIFLKTNQKVNMTFDSTCNDSGIASSNEDKDMKSLSQNVTDSNIIHYLKMVPILEEIVKRIHDIKKVSSSTNKRERYINLMKRNCSNITFEELNMSNLYSNIKNGHSLDDTNLLSVLQLKPLKFEALKLNHHDIKEEVKHEIIIERVFLAYI